MELAPLAESVTLCADVYVPATGDAVGVTATVPSTPVETPVVSVPVISDAYAGTTNASARIGMSRYRIQVRC